MTIPQWTLKGIAPLIAGEVLRDAGFTNLGFSIHRGPQLLTWMEHRKYLPSILKNNGVSAVIVSRGLAEELPDCVGILACKNPRESFYLVHNHLSRFTGFYGEHGPSQIHPSAIIEPGATVASVGVEICEDVVVESGARILAGTRVGARSIIRSGVVLGSHGFQFCSMGGKRTAIQHVGGTSLGEDVEIQTNTNVSRAIFKGTTSIGDETKIDAVVHIAHNVCIGRRASICAGVVIAGHTVIGDDVYFGPGATVLNCITIGDRARVTMGSVVVGSVPAGGHVSGYWAIDHRKFLAAHGQYMSSASRAQQSP